MSTNGDRRKRRLRLMDGRSLQVCEWGPADGQPVIHFHGSGSSRLERPLDLEILARSSVRLLTLDRPGHGRSTNQPGRTLLDWPIDVAQVADHLNLDRFAVSGWSIGGSHALATAFALPDRVTATAVIAPMPPPGHPAAQEGMSAANRATLAAARKVPRLVRLGTRLGAGTLRRNPGRALTRLRKMAPPSDGHLLNDSAFTDLFLPSIVEAFKQGTGPGWESTMIVKPWGFDLSDITPSVGIWHGAADPVVPIAASRFISARLPHAELHEVVDAGHFLLFHNWPEILHWLAHPRHAD